MDHGSVFFRFILATLIVFFCIACGEPTDDSSGDDDSDEQDDPPFASMIDDDDNDAGDDPPAGEFIDDDDDEPPAWLGEAAVYPDTVTVAANERFLVIFTARHRIKAGGGVKVTFGPSLTRVLMCPMNANPRRECGFVEARSTNPQVKLKVDTRYGGDIFGVKLAHITASVEESELAEGEQILFVYGAHERKTYVQETAQDAEVTIQVKLNKLSRWREIAQSPVLTILPQSPRRLNSAVDREKGLLRLSLIDRYGNAATGSDEVDVTLISEDGKEVAHFSGRLIDGTAVIELPTVEGHYFVIRSWLRTLGFVSQVPYVQGERNVYFGDPHIHTKCSDALLAVDPIDAYAYARDAALLDFAAVADHAEFVIRNDTLTRYLISRPRDSWEWLRQTANAVNETGLTTLVGFECTISQYRHPRDGHNNVYYRDDSGPIYAYKKRSPTAGTVYSVRGLCRKLDKAGVPALVIPHHTLRADALGDDFPYYHPERMRLAEIYSQHGNSEGPDCPRTLHRPRMDPEALGSLRRAIGPLGYRFGFVGGSDNHTGHPAGTGLPDFTGSENNPGGLTAVIADELTRDSLWTALHERSVYATSGARIHLEFSVNDQPMGSELRGQNHAVIRARAVGADRIVQAEVFKYSSSHGWETVYSAAPRNLFWHATFTDDDYSQSAVYYLRVRQKDDHLAWSSPIWVDAADREKGAK
ncbi:MAG TPA: DUF3604 domain-containing protein [bacterium]|nr:DUF3604 domain-containing protein [bacterium]